jgi:hypothetical protein
MIKTETVREIREKREERERAWEVFLAERDITRDTLLSPAEACRLSCEFIRMRANDEDSADR